MVAVSLKNAAFLFGGLWFNRNFFKHVFDKTFHYTQRGWDLFTWSFAWFFVATAVANEFVRVGFEDEKIYNVLGFEMNGVGIWIAFKVALVMPLSALYAWFLTRIMQRYRIPDGDQEKVSAALIEAAVTVHPSTGDPKTASAERKPASAGSSGG